MKQQASHARLIKLPVFPDSRGTLSVVQYPDHLPFLPVRVFYISRVSSESTRGEHAHHECHQAIVCISGTLTVTVEDGAGKRSYRLDDPTNLLYIPPGVWASQHGYLPETISSVFASNPYDPADYIRDYNEWKALYRV